MGINGWSVPPANRERPLRLAHPDREATCRSDQAAVVEHEELIGPVEGDFAM